MRYDFSKRFDADTRVRIGFAILAKLQQLGPEPGTFTLGYTVPEGTNAERVEALLHALFCGTQCAVEGRQGPYIAVTPRYW